MLLAVEVTQDGNDTRQLMPMLENGQAILPSEHLIGLSDSGYFSGEQLKQTNEKSIEIYVPIPKNNGSAGKQVRFMRDRFTYAAENDGYHCPLHTQCLKENATYKKLERWESMRPWLISLGHKWKASVAIFPFQIENFLTLEKLPVSVASTK